MGMTIWGRSRGAAVPLIAIAMSLLLVGCAGVDRSTVRPAGAMTTWTLVMTPHVDTQPCETDPSVDFTLQPAIMPPMSVSVVLELGATAADAERVADCVEGIMREGTITLVPPGCSPVLKGEDVLACQEAQPH